MPPVPCSTGLTVLDDYPLEDLVPRIDWTPFFQTWELSGHYPAILTDPTRRRGGDRVSSGTPRPCSTGSSGSGCSARAACFGVFRANAVGDDIELYADEERTEQLAVIHTLRQQMLKPPGPAQPRARRLRGAARRRRVADYVGAFAVTTGHGLDELVAVVRGRARRLQRDPGQGARRPAGRGVRRAAARARAPGVLGLRARRGARQRRPDPREVPGDPAGARAIPPAPTTPRSARCSTCCGPRPTRASP